MRSGVTIKAGSWADRAVTTRTLLAWGNGPAAGTSGDISDAAAVTELIKVFLCLG